MRDTMRERNRDRERGGKRKIDGKRGKKTEGRRRRTESKKSF